MPEPFLLGVNYWPRRKGVTWWADFDAGEVRDEFDVIRDLGLTAVRIFLLWEDFQPTPSTVEPRALDELEVVCDIAAERGLRLGVSFFAGHMSGPNFVPGWLLDGSAPAPGARPTVSGGRTVASGYRNPFVDPTALAAQHLQLRAVVGRLRDHPAIWLWDLGNEPDLVALPPDDLAGPAWARALAATIRGLDPTHPLICGTHMASLLRDNGLRLDRIFDALDLSSMHPYPVYEDLARGPLDPDFAAFTCAVTQELSGRPVLAEEFGACTAPPGEPSQVLSFPVGGVERRQFMMAEDELADHVGAVLPRLVEVGAVGALLWCFADFHPDLWDRPPYLEMQHERFFGLVRPDGSLKPHALVMRDFAATAPTVRPVPDYARLGIDGDEFYRSSRAELVALYDRYRTQRDASGGAA